MENEKRELTEEERIAIIKAIHGPRGREWEPLGQIRQRANLYTGHSGSL